MNQYFGLQYAMISKHLWTIASEPSRSRGVFALLLAIEYIVQGGLHQMTSGSYKPKSVYSQVRRSVHASAPHLGPMSNVRVSCPFSLQTFDTLLVPQHMSQIRMECFPYQAVSFRTSWAHDGWGASLWDCLSFRTPLLHSIAKSKRLEFRLLSAVLRHRRAFALSNCSFS